MAAQTILQMFDLSGKVALVTGGAMGIGEGIALRLAEAGAAVMLADVNEEAANSTAAKMNNAGAKAAGVRADVSQVADAQAMVKRTVETFGRLDILVNNAGVYPFSPALQLTEQLWDRVLDINLKGSFFTAQAAANHMVEAGHGGRIVNIASIDGLHPTGYLTHYDSSKGGVVMMTKALALELGPLGIAVNAVAPGGISTPGAAAATAAAGTSAASTTDFTARIPLRRMGEPDDIARVVLFLASDASTYMTGTVTVVDGGYLLS